MAELKGAFIFSAGFYVAFYQGGGEARYIILCYVILYSVVLSYCMILYDMRLHSNIYIYYTILIMLL